MPIFQSATYEYTGETNYHDLKYIRLNNTPNHTVLHAKLAALEGAESALVTTSGMAAISTTLLTYLQQGDHLLAQDCLYGGTHDLITKDLPDMGIDVDFFDPGAIETWTAKLKPNSRAIYVESISNPMIRIPDLPAVVDFARENQLLSIIDNTFATPVNFQPCLLGFDLAVHSCTKFMNGHSDIVAGAVIGRAELIQEIRHKLNHFGASLDPHACFLLQRGIKTLVLRVRQQNQNALAIARFLQSCDSVRKVYYPGVDNNDIQKNIAELFSGFGGVLSFDLADGCDPDCFMENLHLAISAPSLGGVETLVTRPVTTSHAGMSVSDRQKIGISDATIRLSVGIEDTVDLLADVEQALAGCRK